MGIPKDSAAGRRRFERVMEEPRAQDAPEEHGQIRRGWCCGEEAFRKELLAQVEELAREGLRRLGWTETELATRRKSDRAKLKVAMKLRAETTMTLRWIAARLRIGTGASWSHLLSGQQRAERVVSICGTDACSKPLFGSVHSETSAVRTRGRSGTHPIAASGLLPPGGPAEARPERA
jgi:hypothetical protein